MTTERTTARLQPPVPYLGPAGGIQGGGGSGHVDLGLAASSPLKFILVGDSDVGKNEFLAGLFDVDPATLQSVPPETMSPRATNILLDGKVVSVHLWETSGQGRFSAVMRHYARGAHGILLVYDITNRWSFGGMKKWLKEIDEHAPGIPRVLIGNRLHLEFDRSVPRKDAEAFAKRRKMEYFEVSTLAHFNVDECLTQLARLVVERATLARVRRQKNAMSLQEICCREIVKKLTSVHLIDRLVLPKHLQIQVRSFACGSQVAAATLPMQQRAPDGGIVSTLTPRAVRRAVKSSRQRLRRAQCALM